MAEQGEQVRGTQLTKPIMFKGEDIKLDFGILRKPYSLEKDEFYLLTKSTSELKDWQKRFLQIGIGVCLTITSKIIYFLFQFENLPAGEEKSKLSISIAGWEIVSLSIAFGTWLILVIIGKFVLSDKDKLVDSLKQHFSQS